ncbi:MAG: hypothetical protein PHI31_17030 [Desulfuromonadaceae bacterium]|nr:hypothetical protein [Desulfuromonadaceae bacterium]
MKRVTGSLVIVLAAASFSAAAVNVGISTPNASIYVGKSQPAPSVTVIERETVIVREDRHDNGKHKGHYKHKKHKKEREHNGR